MEIGAEEAGVSEKAAISRIVVTVSNQLAPKLARLVPPPPADVAPDLLHYLESPDFAEVVRQVVLWRAMRTDFDEGLTADLREQIFQGLRHAGVTSLDPATALRLLLAAAPLDLPGVNRQTAATTAHLGSAATNNRRLLGRTRSLDEFHAYAGELRARIIAMHSEMRLPHIRVSHSVPYRELYVPPTLSSEVTVDDLSLPGRRTVLLGDPGAGKSTLATKLAFDIASAPGGRVPFLLVLRDFTAWFRAGGRQLLRYLERLSRDPYNLTPPPDAVEYLLRNGRAVVVLDGLDELGEPELRHRVVKLVEGFAHQYPLTPIVVTARKIGYQEAPLRAALFDLAEVEDFGPEQVARYAAYWFTLDASTAPHLRGRLADAFLRESEAIAELRRNPLLLALLCAMYSSEHYLPRNLAQVYEQCALMLFDRWDSLRGITLPHQFHGRLRAAVQHLAWHQLTAPEPLPHSRIIRVLADYLVSKSFDADDAMAAAEQFTEFCTGRAWILTDVGATHAEPLFGFTHRTFMEYFAAEHLVRGHPDALSLWRELRPKVLDGSWEVIGHIALQLYDRNVDDGADQLLRLALKTDVAFPARALHHVTPQPALVREIVRVCLEHLVAGGVQGQEDPLAACLYDALPANAQIIHRALVDHVEDMSVTRHLEAAQIVQGLLGVHRQDPSLRLAVHELRYRLASRGSLVRWPWLSEMDSLRDLHAVVATHGPRTMFEPYRFLGQVIEAPVVTLLSEQATGLDRFDADSVAVAMAQSRQRQWTLLARRPPAKLKLGLLGDALETLLCLPLLEAHLDRGTALEFYPPIMQQALVGARRNGDAVALRKMTEWKALPESVQDLLFAWTRRRFDVLDAL